MSTTTTTGSTTTTESTTTTDSTTTGWNIKPSISAMRTENPILAFVEKLHFPESFINLGLGDPTFHFDLGKPPPFLLETVDENLKSLRFNGYCPSPGLKKSRGAVGKFVHPNLPFDRVFLASGCCQSLFFSIDVLCNPGSNILLPKPGFTTYDTYANYLGIEIRNYNLLPEKEWDIDLVQMETLIDSDTALIVINNPNNPCGSVYSKEHLLAILAIAEKHHIPIMSDEIYADMVFPSSKTKFFPLAELKPKVPILTCGGISKLFSVPGWRLGWVLVYDYKDIFLKAKVLTALSKLCSLIVGPNSLIQSALPGSLDPKHIPKSYLSNLMTHLETNLNRVNSYFAKSDDVFPIMPHGALYVIIHVNIQKLGFSDDVQFSNALLEEKKVLILPLSVFKADPKEGYFRIVLCRNEDILKQAASHILDFIQEIASLQNY